MTGRAVPVFRGVATDKGTVDLEQPVVFRWYVRRLAGKRVEVTVRRPVLKRTTPQNKYYFGVVVQTIAFEWGWRKQELHDALRAEFLVEDGDKPVKRIRSTTELSIEEFSEYIEQIKQMAAESGIYVPDSDEVSL